MKTAKPKCKLVGTDGNIFMLMGRASRTLKEAGQSDKVEEMVEKITSSESYEAALAVLGDYVDIC